MEWFCISSWQKYYEILILKSLEINSNMVMTLFWYVLYIASLHFFWSRHLIEHHRTSCVKSMLLSAFWISSHLTEWFVFLSQNFWNIGTCYEQKRSILQSTMTFEEFILGNRRFFHEDVLPQVRTRTLTHGIFLLDTNTILRGEFYTTVISWSFLLSESLYLWMFLFLFFTSV